MLRVTVTVACVLISLAFLIDFLTLAVFIIFSLALLLILLSLSISLFWLFPDTVSSCIFLLVESLEIAVSEEPSSWGSPDTLSSLFLLFPSLIADEPWFFSSEFSTLSLSSSDSSLECTCSFLAIVLVSLSDGTSPGSSVASDSWLSEEVSCLAVILLLSSTIATCLSATSSESVASWVSPALVIAASLDTGTSVTALLSAGRAAVLWGTSVSNCSLSAACAKPGVINVTVVTRAVAITHSRKELRRVWPVPLP